MGIFVTLLFLQIMVLKYKLWLNYGTNSWEENMSFYYSSEKNGTTTMGIASYVKKFMLERFYFIQT